MPVPPEDQSQQQRPVVSEYFCPRCGGVYFFVQSIRDAMKQGDTPVCPHDSNALKTLEQVPTS